MKKQDFLWLAGVLIFLALITIPPFSEHYQSLNAAHPYFAGFAKFAVLATMGDILSLRLVRREWTRLPGLPARAIVYGFLGMTITLAMQLFSGGVAAATDAGFLPFGSSTLARAFMTSLFMNCFFAPVFMAFHRLSDTWIDLWCTEKKRPSLRHTVQHVDFCGFICFVVCKTVPLFWVPAHTITFLLPGQYRVLFAACLSVAMGAILSFSKSRSQAASCRT